MLEIKKITKLYKTENFTQRALDNVSIKFRENEFASILGPSGSGKTTLLNIIGGLDNYTTGDLIINGVSTKDYKDADWDAYRNNSIGFVFQSYNLIPHQTALSNVELALTLSGVGKKERRRRAKEVLKKVGLERHMHKKPSQMSGGQMQRIAIARALVNNPDILLADEPTGALDSETSLQIMDLLKEIAEDRLVIMVTHNPELASKYSTRIINLKDGKITSDTNPYNESDEKVNNTKKKRSKKSRMSFKTALGLSLNNLMTKKGRTFMVSFAGSIGIIGIALILSLSSGVDKYIAKVEEETLSSYPLTIEKTTYDTESLMESMNEQNDKKETTDDKIYINDTMTNMLELMSSEQKVNNLEEFKNYLDHNDKIKEQTNDIQYSYDLSFQIYKNDDSLTRVNPGVLDEYFSQMMANSPSNMTMGMQVFRELTKDKDLLKNQYQLLEGSWPESKNELVLILDENNQISDMVLYNLGLLDQNKLTNLMSGQSATEEKEKNKEVQTFEFSDVINSKYKLILNTDYYEKENGIWINKANDKEYLKNLVNKGLDLKISGIVKPKEDNVANFYTNAVGYTKELTDYVINSINATQIAKEVKNNDKNILTGIDYKTPLEKEEVKESLGIVDLENPSSINIYPKDFEAKKEIENIIEDYNKEQIDNKKEDLVINYTDYVGLLMSSVTTIIDVISYVLISFVGISMVVSSIMIGIITYISVLERIKEIGILRAIGASKKDIAHVFNAETFIIGISAGILGVVITILLNIPINIIIKNLTDISGVSKLPFIGGIILVIISVCLTVIAGLIPARFASKKDPVDALRTE